MLGCSVILSDTQCRDAIQTIKYEDIYGTLPEQIRAAKVWDKILKTRTLKLAELEDDPYERSEDWL